MYGKYIRAGYDGARTVSEKYVFLNLKKFLHSEKKISKMIAAPWIIFLKYLWFVHPI